MERQLRVLMARLAAQRINQILKRKLNYTQREVVKLRSGVGDGNAYSRPECAQIFDMPVAQIGRVEEAAIKKLKAEDPLLWELIVELGKMRKKGLL